MHTAHVESVAWLASRKDVVCFFFYAFSMICYVHYAHEEKRIGKSYGLCLILGIAAMLSKGYAVVLPAVLLCYDLCFGRRVGRLGVMDLIDKIPFVAAAVTVSVVTVFAQGTGAALIDLKISWLERVAALGQVFSGYVGRALLPIHLSAMYIIDASTLVSWPSAAGVVLAGAAVTCFILLRRKRPIEAFGIALFVLPLGPVMNIFFTLRTWMADRYLLLPTLGSALLLTGFAMWIHDRIKKAKPSAGWVVPTIAAALVSIYGGLTVQRIDVWTDPVMLWSDTLRKQLCLPGSGPFSTKELQSAPVRLLPDSRPAMWLAEAYKYRGQKSEAADLIRWVGSMPHDEQFEDEITLARLDIDTGSYDKALIRLKPLAQGNTWLAPIALGWMGVAYENKGQPQAAWAAHLKALNLYQDQGRPGTPALLDLAGMAFRANQFDQAAQWYQKARKEGPTDPRAVFFLGVSQERMGRVEKAFRLYEETLELEGKAAPNIPFSFVDVHLQMGLAAKRLGLLQESATHFEEWLRRAPDDPRKAMVERQLADVQVRPRGKQG
jgi:tetratricopeptide (TPR) repeat protein